MIKIKRTNGTGCIYKVKERRRKPWRVYVTAGWNENGKQLKQSLGYFKTYDEAVISINKYFDKPYDLNNKNITFSMVWEKVKNNLITLKDSGEMSDSNVTSLTAAFNNDLKDIHNREILNLKYVELQDILNNCNLGKSGQGFIITVCKKIYEYAIDILELPIINIAVKLKKHEGGKKYDHIPLTNEELNLLWNNTNDDVVKTIILMCYTGLRPNELFTINLKNIHINERYMIGGFKTESGTDRIIPLHKKIVPLIEYFFNKQCEYPFKEIIEEFNYGKYGRRFNKIMSNFGMNHTPYDCRHTFTTKMKYVGANEHILKRIMGHSIQDLTERVYTHRTIEELVKEVNKID